MYIRNVDRGEIYWYDYGKKDGAMICGKRPVVVIQSDIGNRNSATTVVAAITSSIKKEYLPFHVYLDNEFGLSKPSMILLEQLSTVNQKDLGEYIGFINDELIMKLIDKGMKKIIGLWSDKPMNYSGADIRCLCGTCATNYRNTESYKLKRVKPFSEKGICDKCGRPGRNFILYDRKRKEM